MIYFYYLFPILTSGDRSKRSRPINIRIIFDVSVVGASVTCGNGSLNVRKRGTNSKSFASDATSGTRAPHHRKLYWKWPEYVF